MSNAKWVYSSTGHSLSGETIKKMILKELETTDDYTLFWTDWCQLTGYRIISIICGTWQHKSERHFCSGCQKSSSKQRSFSGLQSTRGPNLIKVCRSWFQKHFQWLKVVCLKCNLDDIPQTQHYVPILCIIGIIHKKRKKLNQSQLLSRGYTSDFLLALVMWFFKFCRVASARWKSHM